MVEVVALEQESMSFFEQRMLIISAIDQQQTFTL